MSDRKKHKMETQEVEENYKLTEWGFLYGVLTEYGIDVSHITGRVIWQMLRELLNIQNKQ